MNKVSIIVPIYNSQETLDKCIVSLLNQTYKNIEVILVDDGSIDQSYNICDKYHKLDNRIILIRQNNQGVSIARNVGLNIATGNYIAFCDSDDWVESNWIELLLNSCIENNCNISVCGFYWLDKSNNIKINKTYGLKNEKKVIDISCFYELRRADIFNILWNKMFKTEIIKRENIKFNEELSLAEDVIFILQYLQVSNSDIGIVTEPLYNYIYKQGNNLASRYNEDLFLIYNKLFSELYITMKVVNVDLNIYSNEYYSNYFSALIRCLNNTLSKENNKNFFQKVKKNNTIIRSEQFIECLSNVSLQEYNKLYKLILRSKQYILFYLFCKIYEVKKIINERGI